MPAAPLPLVPLKGGFQMQTIRGTVRTLGQNRIHMSGHTYAFVTFDLEGGGDLMLENVVVLNRVGSELEPGTTGTFHVIGNKRATSLIAFESADGRSRDDIPTFRRSIRTGKVGISFFITLACSFVLILSSLILMSLFRHTPFFVWVLYYTLPPILIFRFFMGHVPSESDIRAAIAETNRQAA